MKKYFLFLSCFFMLSTLNFSQEHFPKEKDGLLELQPLNSEENSLKELEKGNEEKKQEEEITQQTKSKKRTVDERNPITVNEEKFSEMEKESSRISALGSAMGAIDLGSTPTHKIRLGAGVGNTPTSQAIAVGVGYAPTDRLKINTKFSTSTNFLEQRGISIGASYDLDI